MAAAMTEEEVCRARELGRLACRRCGTTKGLCEFVRQPKNVLGVSSTCKRCHADDQKVERIARPDHVRARDRRRVRSPEYRAYQEAWRQANMDRFNQSMREAIRRRRARKAGNGVCMVTQRDLDRMARRQGGCCGACGVPGPLTVDHIVPIARGGRHAIGNLWLLCWQCNRSKGARLLAEWRMMMVTTRSRGAVWAGSSPLNHEED